MRTAIDLFEELKHRYNNALPFNRICDDEHIVVVKSRLPDGVNSFYATSNGHRVIVLNAALSFHERRDYAWHELYHHFRSVPGAAGHHNKREETNADVFAALCRAPVVRDDDTDEALVERYGLCRRLARIRIQTEQRRMG